MKRKSILLFTFVFACIAQANFAQNAVQGQKLFKTSCSACHTVGKGKIVGPDLINISAKRNEKWLLSWIRSSQGMVKKNDPVAVKLFNEYNKMVMPDANLTDPQIKDILAWIKSASPAAKPATSAIKPVVTPDNSKKQPAPSSWVSSEFQLKSTKSPEEIDPRKLNAALWQKTQVTKIPLAPQNITTPGLQQSTVDSVSIRSMYFGNQLAVLAEWKDLQKNTEVETDQFCDQFAVQLPLTPDNIPSYMMGNAGGKVHIVHWKAIWQEDCEKGFQDVQMKYPNMWVDVYPGLEKHNGVDNPTFANKLSTEDLVAVNATGNIPATYSKNPISQIKRKEPVEEASAEGFGTLATQAEQAAKGWATWQDGKWMVCIIVPVNTGLKDKATLTDKTKLAFAIWDGGSQNIGGRKHFAPWMDVILEK